MFLNKSTTLQEKTKHNGRAKIMSQFVNTQNIIRNKFEKAYMNRIKHEQPLLMNSSIDGASLSTTKQSRAMKITAKVSDSKNYKKDLETSVLYINNPNELCERLRILLSTMHADDNAKHVEEIHNIIMKLNELDLLV